MKRHEIMAIIIFLLLFFILFFYINITESKKRTVMEIIAMIHQMEQDIKPDNEDADLGPFFSQEKLIQKKVLIDCQNNLHDKYLISGDD